MANPSWDEGTFDGWQAYNTEGGPAYDPDDTTYRAQRWVELGIPEQYSLRIDLDSGEKISVGNLNFLPVDPNVDYYAGVYLQGGEVDVYLMIKYYSAGFIHVETQYQHLTGPFTGWPLKTIVSVPPPPAVYARFSIRIENNDTDPHTVWLDDAFMMPVSYAIRRKCFTWDNAYGGINLIPSKNIIRVYSMISMPYESSSTNKSSVYIEPSDGVPAGAIACIKVDPYPTFNQVVFNPPIYNGERKYSSLAWRIRNMVATGGKMFVVVYFNAADYWTEEDL